VQNRGFDYAHNVAGHVRYQPRREYHCSTTVNCSKSITRSIRSTHDAPAAGGKGMHVNAAM
jgi:hypothetical protein